MIKQFCGVTLSLLLLSGFLTTVRAQFETNVSNVGTTAAPFLEIGVGARAMAMGGAYVALANDPTAVYYNPAGIVWSDRMQLELMHNEWLIDTNFDFIAATLPLGFFNSSIGMSMTMVDYGEQKVRTVERPTGTGELYGSRDYAVTLSYASAMTTQFSFGISAKYVNQKIWNVSGGTMAMDVGVFYNTPVQGLRMGMSINNFGGKIRMSGRDLHSTFDPDQQNGGIDRIPVEILTDGSPLPVIFRAGISYQREVGMFGSILLTGDLKHPNNNTESVNLGAEYGFGNTFFLRAGYANLWERDSISGITIGGGVDYVTPGIPGFRVDYAFSDWGVLQDAHRFSLGIVF
ncbi:MAG TPA: PorV/PorQ family protein [Calditrichia bacterium]|nr:PorV/PorQ family protein [Calditrichia bacterium]